MTPEPPTLPSTSTEPPTLPYYKHFSFTELIYAVYMYELMPRFPLGTLLLCALELTQKHSDAI